MRFLSKLALVALLALSLGSMSRAQGLVNPLLPVTGTREVELRGVFQFEPDDVFTIHGSFGPFLNPNLQVGGSLDYTHADDDVTTLGLFANYHFPGASPTLPFVGAFVGFATGGGDETTSYGVQGGVKHFINSSVALTGALVYRDFTDDDAGDAVFGLQFGLAIYLR